MSSSPGYVHFQAVDRGWAKGQMVLMYHSVAAPPLFHGWRGLYVTPHWLARQVGELQAARLPFASLPGKMEEMPTQRQVVLTFDDAYRSLFVNGLPVLERFRARAITYVVSSLIGKTNEWDRRKKVRRERLMNEGQLREWLAEGHEIGSHTLTHANLTELSTAEARREIAESKARLEDQFGQPVRHFGYPYGAWNVRVRDLVQEAGYATAVTTDPGLNFRETNPWELRRCFARHEKPWKAALLRR